MAVTNSGMTLYQDMDTDTNWAGEDGISTEEFQQGTASQQWIVAKNADETATLTLATSMTGAKYIIAPIISTISPFYTLISANLSDGTNTELFTLSDQLGGLLHRAVAGQWQFNSHCMEFGNNGGVLVLANFASIAIRCDNSASGNIRSVLNTYIDAIYYGTGRTIGGTTTTDKLFKESNDLDISSDKFDGCTLEFSGGIDAQTDIEITTTLGNSYGETLTFREVGNTSNIYTLTITGNSDFQATSISIANSNVTTNFISSGATLWQMIGGSITGAGTTIFKAAQVVEGVVFTDRTSLTHSGANFEGNTVNTSGVMIVLSTGTFTGNIFNNSTSASSIQVSDLGDAPLNTFISDGSNHAVELTSIGGGSMDWDNQLTSYDAGAAGSPVTPTSTGNEAIYVNVTTASDLTINVQTGSSVPSIRVGAGFTGSVNVVAGAVPVLITTQTSDGTKIQNTRVLVEAGLGGAFPSDVTVTITSVTTTASVAHTAHGLSNGDEVVIRGAVENEYNGIQTISNVSTNAYDYTIIATTSPATGTILSTFAILSGLTDINGEITATRTYSVDTPLSSRSKARKSTTSPYFKTGAIVGTIDKDAGLTVTVVMLSDE